MPNKQDILTAIKNLDSFLRLPELKGAKPRLNKNGNPYVHVGGFNMVFQLTHMKKTWAFRVWHVPMGENQDRFNKISKYLTTKRLPYFADFIYDEKALVVDGQHVDTIRMEWLDGVLFKEYIEKNLKEPVKLKALADKFLKMCQTLRDNQISHGDLQEGNILVSDSGEIRLVDYDSVCIPEIEGQKELVTGLKGYQHPSKFKGGTTSSLKSDYFSELIIYLSLLAFSERPELWSKYQVKDTNYLLFAETDFENLKASQIYADLKGISPKIDHLLIVLKSYLNTDNYLDLKPFSELRPNEEEDISIPSPDDRRPRKVKKPELKKKNLVGALFAIVLSAFIAVLIFTSVGEKEHTQSDEELNNLKQQVICLKENATDGTAGLRESIFREIEIIEILLDGLGSATTSDKLNSVSNRIETLEKKLKKLGVQTQDCL